MGSGASTHKEGRPRSKSQSNANLVINDQQVIALAETSSAVADRVKHLLKAPFNVTGQCTAETIKICEESWQNIMNDKPIRYQTYRTVENPKNPDPCFVWFVKKFYMRISEFDFASIDLYPIDISTQCRLVGLMVKETFRCIANPHSDPLPGQARHETNKFYVLVKRHFLMDVTSKQYKLMCVALLDALKYCFDKEYTGLLKVSWELVFTALLKGLLKYAVAFEIIHLPASQQSSYSSSSFMEDRLASAGPEDMRLMDSYSMLAEDEKDDPAVDLSYSSLDSKNQVTTNSLGGSTSTRSISVGENRLGIDPDKHTELAAAQVELVKETCGLNE